MPGPEWHAGCNGGSDAFLAVFDEHYAAIASYLRRRLPAADADDLAAEVFVTAFRRRESFDPARGPVDGWLFGIATNLLRNHIRTERRRLEALAALAREGAEPLATNDVSTSDQDGVVASALLALSSADRDALFLFACADLSYDQIAAALGIPVGTVRSRISRARATLREELAHPNFRCQEAASG